MTNATEMMPGDTVVVIAMGEEKTKQRPWKSFLLRTGETKGNFLICITRHEKWVDPKAKYYIVYPEGVTQLSIWLKENEVKKMTKEVSEKIIALGFVKKVGDLKKRGVI